MTTRQISWSQTLALMLGAVAAVSLVLYALGSGSAHAQSVPVTPQQALTEPDLSRVQILTSNGPVLLSDLSANATVSAVPGIPNTGVGGNADQGLSTGSTAVTTAVTVSAAPVVTFGPSGTLIGTGFGSRQDIRVIDRNGKNLGIYKADITGTVVIGAFPPGVAEAPLSLIGL